MKKLTLFLSAMLLACATNLWADVLSIDFESASTTYTDWTFVEMTSQQTGSITAHGGTYYGTTGGKASAFITTKNAISYPQSITFYVSKQSDNTTSSSWKLQVSSDNTTWTDVKEQSAASMNKGTWVEVKQSLSSYTNVYVRIAYSGSTATRNIDDISLSYSTVPPAVAAPVFEVPEGAVQANGSFSAAFNLTISCATSGASIFYTLDGTDPAESSTVLDYTAPIAISKSTIVRAIAMDGDANLSNETSATYCYINSEATAYTTTEAIAVIDGGLGLANELYVKGTISEVTSYSSNYGSLTYTITDGTSPFVIYSGLNIDGEKFTGTNSLKVGDEVVVKGLMIKYGTTYEMDKNNQLVSRVVKTPQIEADDVLFGKIFSTGKTKELVVAGYNLTDAITYTLSEDAAFTVDGTLTAEGGTLTITFTGTNEGDYSATLTLTSGTITLPVAISATLMSLTGEGTKENPFTVEDVIAINSSLGTSQKYWVIGYILGSCSTGPKIAETPVNSNLALGATSDAKTFIPVELATVTSGSGARATLNVVEHTDNIGKQVKVCGTLETYFSVAGVKNIKTADEYEIISNPTAIDNATLLSTPTVKTIEKGQLVIIRDGVKYSAMGVRLQ